MNCSKTSSEMSEQTIWLRQQNWQTKAAAAPFMKRFVKLTEARNQVEFLIKKENNKKIPSIPFLEEAGVKVGRLTP